MAFAMVKNELHKDLFTGTVFVFRGQEDRPVEATLLGWYRIGYTLQAARRIRVHQACGEGLADGAEPCAV